MSETTYTPDHAGICRDIAASIRDEIRANPAWATVVDRAADLIDALTAERDRLQAIVDAAWEVRREDRDYNPCPDYGYKGVLREKLNGLLDAWKGR